jgi:hypothetical protein
MMKIFFSKTAVTLIELLVAIGLISTVLVGVFSINMVLNNNSQDYGQKYLVKSATQTTLNHILNNVSLAYGSANADDEAVLIGPGFGDPNTFCIHQCGTTTNCGVSGGSGQNLINSPNDIWLCYNWVKTITNPYQIEWCAQAYSAGVDPRGASSCSTSSTLIPNPLTGATITFLGSAYSITNTAGTNLASSPSFVLNGGQLLFSINILNCLDNSLLSCQATGSSTDPMSNPEVQLFGSVIPLQASGS